MLLILALTIATLIFDRYKTSVVFLFASAALVLSGAIGVGDYFAGLSNISILTIFLLIVITSGINDNFNLAAVFSAFFKGVKGPRTFIFRMGLGVASFSAFMNNTPVVAVMMPHVYKWGRSHKVSPSKLLMPLSFAAIIGGVITLIGTSTNLVLNGLLEQNSIEPLGFFDFLLPGLMITGLCLLIIIVFAPLLLKEKQDVLSSAEANKREYMVETCISQNSPLANKSVEEAGLRNLEGVFLAEIVRNNRLIAPVSPDQILREEDVLLFAGDTSTIFDLVKNKSGLDLSKTDKFNLVENTEVVEAVVAQNSRLDRKNVKELGFRERYDAAIIGIHRRGEKLSGKIGSIELRTGDLLLMVAGSEFKSRNARREDMIVISSLPSESGPANNKKIGFALASVAILGLAATGFISLFESLLAIGLVQMVLGFLTLDTVKKSISLELLVILISALAMGEALISSGAANSITEVLFSNATQWSPMLTIMGVFAATFILTSFVTNVAAVSIIFPVVLSLAPASPLSTEALFITAAYGASCCFITPYAYQTNLMVMELGKYNFNDFLRLGSIVSLFYAAAYFLYAYFAFV